MTGDMFYNMCEKSNRFSEIVVFEEGPDIYARNGDGRVLFRYNKIVKQLSLFRSHRMTEDEKVFCLLMVDKYGSKSEGITREQALKALNYEIEQDLYCT